MDSINDYVPSILNPRTIRKSLTQVSNVSHCSLSLKRTNNNSIKTLNEVWCIDELREESAFVCLCNSSTSYHPSSPKRSNTYSVVNNSVPKNSSLISSHHSLAARKRNSGSESFTGNVNQVCSFTRYSCCSQRCAFYTGKEILPSLPDSLGFSDIGDINEINPTKTLSIVSEETVICNAIPIVSVSFILNNCDKVDIDISKSKLKKVSISRESENMNVNCEIFEGSQLSDYTGNENNLNTVNEYNSLCPQKRKVAAINLEIKKQKLTEKQSKENAKVLILKTNAIEELTDVIIQPPNYKLVKQKINDKRKRKDNVIGVKNCHLKQKSIEAYFRSKNVLNTKRSLDPIAPCNNDQSKVCEVKNLVRDDVQEMNKNSGVVDVKYDGRTSFKSGRNEAKTPRQHRSPSPRRDIRASISDVPSNLSPKSKKDSAGSFSPRRHMESLQFNMPLKSKSHKTSITARSNVPHYKIVAGTHFAVDAFSYGEIPNVKHYFLTHFHSDHYSGLKKSFNKLLFCSKITADLCTSRLGVSSKCIQVLTVDETTRIEGVEVTVLDANHCPGAIMLVFTLPSGKSMLHTGDFRASPAMESYPVFWNKDVHTVYLDTTYCNPRYDFPTQEQSLEMAMHLLRQKKMAIEKAGKKFSTVLIVCGSYTIGKEKFFLGVARRVGCSVWACPEKERVLQAVQGHATSRAPPRACQLHVVPMRDLTHEKLRNYLDSLQGEFTEVVAFKPSGWENGKNSSVEKDSVTIHGIPYSEHSSFSELIRFVKFLKPRQVIPTVDISGGIKAVAKYFPCPLVSKDDIQCQSRLTDFFSVKSRQQLAAVT